MTVKELMNELSKYDEDMEIKVRDEHGIFCDFFVVTQENECHYYLDYPENEDRGVPAWKDIPYLYLG